MKPIDPLEEPVKEPTPTAQEVDQKNIDQTDAEENFSTAAEGENPVITPPGEPTGSPAASSVGSMPDSESISDNEDGEYDREKIEDK